jgi:hypothetical protein
LPVGTDISLNRQSLSRSAHASLRFCAPDAVSRVLGSGSKIRRKNPPSNASCFVRLRRQARGAAVALASVDMANIQVEDILAGTPAVQCKTKVRHPFPSAPAAFEPRRK